MKHIYKIMLLSALSIVGEAHGISNLQYSALEFAGIITASAFFTYQKRNVPIWSTYKHSANEAIEENIAHGRNSHYANNIFNETPDLIRDTKQNLAEFASWNILSSLTLASSILIFDSFFTPNTLRSFFLPFISTLSVITFAKCYDNSKKYFQAATKTLKYATLKAGKVAIISVVGLFALEKITNLIA